MNIESITDELKLEKQSLEAERSAAFKIAPPGEYQAANYQRRESIIIRFEYLLSTLAKQQDIESRQNLDYHDQREQIVKLKEQNAELRREKGLPAIEEIANRDGQIKELQRIIAELTEDLDRETISNAVSPGGEDLNELNRNQARELSSVWAERDDLIKENKQLDAKVRENEVFFEGLKGILNRTRPVRMESYYKDYFGQGG